MAEMLQFEVLSSATNAVVARHLQRNFPGVLLQGDTLKSLLDEVEELLGEAASGNSAAAVDIGEVLKEQLLDLLSHYEQVLREHGYELPYPKSVGSGSR